MPNWFAVLLELTILTVAIAPSLEAVVPRNRSGLKKPSTKRLRNEGRQATLEHAWHIELLYLTSLLQEFCTKATICLEHTFGETTFYF